MFKIETANDKLKAEKGNATTVFTVTNTTLRPLRGIARIKPLGSTESAWLKIEGETERDFPPGEKHEFKVNFSKPQPPEPQPAGSFQFRFDVVSAANPDEDFTEGPIVTVEVAASGAAKKFPWWILIVVGILLVVGAVAAILVFRNGGDEPLPSTPTPTATPTPTPTPSPTPTVTPTATPTPTPTPKPPQTPTPPQMSKKEYGFDRPGFDFHHFNTTSVQVCEDACRENAQCRAYTFGNYNNCWLKNKIPPQKKDPLYTSGTKLFKIPGEVWEK
ncbi:MAG TPA: PAN domain-containing protein [Pyrinomonadaceae bacterium]|nr:PAN domain-containing protein [Pyrinomonadaceae bacterium]